jgi:hypothetical protein
MKMKKYLNDASTDTKEAYIFKNLKKSDYQHGAIDMFFFGTYARKIEFWKIS